MEMDVLTVGLKMMDKQGKVFIMRYVCSKNWTIPSTVINEEDLKTDATCLKSVFKLVPGGIAIMSIDKIACSKSEETVRSENNSKEIITTVKHNMMIFEAIVEVTADQSLLDIPLKFDYAQWMQLDSLIHIPLTNRITRVLIEHEMKKIPMETVLSGIM